MDHEHRFAAGSTETASPVRSPDIGTTSPLLNPHSPLWKTPKTDRHSSPPRSVSPPTAGVLARAAAAEDFLDDQEQTLRAPSSKQEADDAAQRQMVAEMEAAENARKKKQTAAELASTQAESIEIRKAQNRLNAAEENKNQVQVEEVRREAEEARNEARKQGMAADAARQQAEIEKEAKRQAKAIEAKKKAAADARKQAAAEEAARKQAAAEEDAFIEAAVQAAEEEQKRKSLERAAANEAAVKRAAEEAAQKRVDEQRKKQAQAQQEVSPLLSPAAMEAAMQKQLAAEIKPTDSPQSSPAPSKSEDVIELQVPAGYKQGDTVKGMRNGVKLKFVVPVGAAAGSWVRLNSLGQASFFDPVADKKAADDARLTAPVPRPVKRVTGKELLGTGPRRGSADRKNYPRMRFAEVFRLDKHETLAWAMHVALDQPASDLGAAGTLLKKEIKVASVEADFILKNQLEARLAEIEAATS